MQKQCQQTSHRQLLGEKLKNKYELSLCFYMAKSVHQILRMSSKCETYLEFSDIKILSEEVEYLKRVYYYRTLAGKPELEPRMKLISQHYATNPALSTFTYEYPMMVITNTKSLFVRRKKRLRKIQAGEASSDQTQQNQSHLVFEQTHTEYYLDELNESSLQEGQSEQSSFSYQSETYDIYEGESKDHSDGNFTSKIQLKASEEHLTHLIQDHTQPNQQINSSNYGSPTPSTGKIAFANIENHPKTAKQSMVSVTPIEEKHPLSRERYNGGTLGNYLDFILERPINLSGLGLRFDNPIIEAYTNPRFRSEPQSIEQERVQRASKRQAIREKAEELLRKVRNSNQKSKS